MQVDDLIMISVDDHICEPKDMFDAHVPARYRDHAPRVVLTDEGREQWMYGDLAGRSLGLNAVAGKPREYFNVDAARYDEMRAGCYLVAERVRDMDAGGQLAGLNFPNWTGFAGQVLNQGPDRTVNLVMIQAYNDWHVDEWCGAAPGRFIPCGILPLFDAELAAAEVRRLARKGCHAVAFSENPAALNMPSIHSNYWDPLFSACSDTGTVLCCHLGSSSQNFKMADDAPLSVIPTVVPALTIFTLADFVWARFWTRFPDLKVSLSEGDLGWIPYFLQRAEHVQDVHSGWTRSEFPPGSGPTDVFKRHLVCCFIKDRVGASMLHRFNIDHVCWESDYPHSDTAWPQGPEQFLECMQGHSDDVINRVSHLNAMKLYQFDPFARTPREECTVGALRARAGDVNTVTVLGRMADDDEPERYRKGGSMVFSKSK